jgi:two-component system chemotaxis sensor kinase CheA
MRSTPVHEANPATVTVDSRPVRLIGSPQEPSVELQLDLSDDDQALFLAEIDEMLHRFEAALVNLERTPDDQELVQVIFRAAHTIKGNSSAIGHTRMAALTHAMETRLDDVRNGVAPVTRELVEALLKAGDVLKLLRDEVETHRMADVDVEAATAAVERRAGLREALPPEGTREKRGRRAAPAASSTTIRIDVARLDALLNLVGELVIDRTRLVQLGKNIAARFGDHRVIDDLQLTALHIVGIVDELQEQMMKSRMLPIESVFSRLPRVVRDIASKQAKQIDFIIEGKDTELDRSVIEEIGESLLHLIRNSVDHGLEPPAERVAAGKPPIGKLRLSAHHTDNHIVITLDDDGRGVPLDNVKRKAVERGAITAAQADRMTDVEAVQLIFEAGLSTARELSDVSGRGVGMDIVRANIEKINGSVEVSTRRSRGTTFTIRLPLTYLAISRRDAMQLRGAA